MLFRSLVALIPISKVFKLYMVNYILNNTFQVGVMALVVVFQPEIRRALEYIGRTSISLSAIEKNSETSEKVIKEIVSATSSLARQKIGALMIFEQKIGLNDIAESGTALNANVSSGLLINIFIPNTPLHDGAVIIKDYSIRAAGCFLPLTENNLLSKDIGTRHRAAIGITEKSDAISLIVSEETGYISYAVEGRLYRNISIEELQGLLSGIYLENEKINIYKKISLIESDQEYHQVIEELIDRFGDLPKSVENIISLSLIKALMAKNNFYEMV